MTRIFKGISIEKLRRAVGFELKQVIKSHYVYGKQWVSLSLDGLLIGSIACCAVVCI